MPTDTPAPDRSVTVRIWNGCKVISVITVNQLGGSTYIGPAGGAGNSTHVDIEIDPWANLIVDHRVEHPHPVSIREQASVG